MASWFTRVLDRITPWDRGGEAERRKKREEEQRQQQSQPSRPAPQPTVRQPSNNIRNQTIGGQDFLGFGTLNSTPPKNTVSVPRNEPQEPQKPQVKDFNTGSVDKGLDAGKSWEDISRDTGVSLDRVREYSQRTRPEYGIKRRETPALNQQKPLLSNLMSGQLKQQEQQVKEDRREAELDRYFENKARTLRDEAPRQNLLTEIADMVPFLGTKRSAERGRGLNDPSTERQNIGLSTTLNMSLSDIEKLAPEDRADLLNQARRVNNLELNTGLAGDLLSVIPGARFLSSGRARLARAQGRRQAAKTLARNTAKTAAVGTPVGTAISAGMQKYLTGDVDWGQALRGGLMGATVGQIIDPFGSLDNFVDVPRYSSRSAFRRARGVDIPDTPNTPDVPTTRPIEVQTSGSDAQIPVRNTTPQGNIIREVGGDSPNVTRVPTSEDVQASRFRNQDFGGADQRIEGVTGPVSRQEYTTKVEIDAERQALNDALANKEINKTQHKKANKDLDDAEKSLDGRKIEVQEEKTVPVREVTDIPVDDEVGAGSVRPTKVVDRTAEKTEAAARQQAQTTPLVGKKPTLQDPLDSLKAEARKYKSAEEFVDSKPYVLPKTNAADVTKLSDKDLDFFAKQGYTSITDRHGNTRKITPKAPTSGNVIEHMNPTGGVHVDYNPQARMTAKLADNITTLDKTMGKNPDEMITIYRGAPKNQKDINPGDFITTNRELAQSYGENVISKKVKLSDVLDDSNSPLGEEYLYRPKQLTDLYNQAHSKAKATPAQQAPKAESKAMGVENDPLASLKQEALKYKSAEEFAEAQGALFRGEGTDAGMGLNIRGEGLYTGTKDVAKRYSKDGNLKAYKLHDDAKVLDANSAEYKRLRDKSYDARPITGNWRADDKVREKVLAKSIREAGYDALNAGDETVIFNTKKATELTDLYNQATKEATTPEVDPRVDTPLSPSPQARVGQSDRFAPTGVYREGRKGNVYEAANRQAEIELGRKEMSTRSAEDLVDELDGRTGINEGSQRKIEAAIENLKRADPEGKASADLQRVLTQTLVSDRTKIAQMLAIGRRVLRRTATSDALTNRWSAKMARVGDLKNISDADLQSIQRANDNFTTVRDKARAAEEAFKNDPSAANLSAVKKALADEQKANINAIDTELAVSKRVLKGEKGPKAEKVISDLEAEADLHMMDSITASQLSGPATGARNLFGTYAAGVENRIGANLRSKLISRMSRFDGANVGGFDRASARAGRREGWDKYVSDIQRRSEYSGNNPFKHARNFATSLNQAGESSMHSQIQSRLGAYYKNQLKAQGVSGDELTRRTEFMRLTDPDNMQREFLDQTMKASGLSGIITKGKRVEQGIADMISGGLEQTGLISPKWSKKTARAITRLAVGYPTATGNFIVQSGKRATLGLPSFIESGVMLRRGNPTAAAQAFDRALKEAGSGGAMLGLGFALGSANLVSGSYPDDPDERARWEREGISENSIRIGNTWRPIPQSLGMMGLPIMLGAAVGRDGGEGVQEMFTPKNLTKLLPHDQVQGFMNLVSGGGTEAQEKNFVASTIRSGVPLGSLFNQVSKGLDPTKNDTTTRSFWRNVFDQVVTGIPGQHEFADIPDKRSDTGEVITNPGFLDVMTGASTASQAGGEQHSREINQNINSQVQSMADLGIFSNEGMREVLDDNTKLVWDKALRGEQLDPSDIKALNSGLVKGVTTGRGADSDTAYRERGDYDMDYAVLNLKKQLLEADPTAKPSNIKDLEVQIKRSQVLLENEIPYEMFNVYQTTGLEDWRKLREDNPELYQQLWELDEMFAQAGGSYGRGDPTKQKYYASTSRGGSGGSGGSGRSRVATNFGTLGTSPLTPRVREYDTGSMNGTSNIPVIRVQRPNIVHRIGRG